MCVNKDVYLFFRNCFYVFSSHSFIFPGPGILSCPDAERISKERRWKRCQQWLLHFFHPETEVNWHTCKRKHPKFYSARNKAGGMAFLDNPGIILAHIRQSHVTSDDTGMCEMVLVDQDVDLEKCQLALVPGNSNYTSTGSDSFSEGGSIVTDPHACDLSQSMDITSSWDFGIRRRSNTGWSAAEALLLVFVGDWLKNQGWCFNKAPNVVATQMEDRRMLSERVCVPY